MPVQLCPTHSNCPGQFNQEFDFPGYGYSSEAPDRINYFAFDDGNFIDPPPLGSTWNDASVPGFAQSNVSQSQANQQATNNNLINTNGQTLPPGSMVPAPLFGNDLESSTILCPGGVPFTWTMPPGAVIATSQAIADAQAQSIAARSAQTEAICLSGLSPAAAGVGTFYTATVTFTAPPSQPISFAITSGQLPPGLGLVTLPNNGGCVINGTPAAAGVFTFTLQASNPDGTFMARTFSISVLGTTNIGGMPGGEVSVAYSYQLTAAFGVAPYTFTAISLPAGLTVSSSGLVSGTPSHSGTFSASIQCVDSAGTVAVQSGNSFTIVCDANAAWTTNPGNCRLMISGYFGTLFPVCGGYTLGGTKDWDGTWSQFSIIAGQPTYQCDPSMNRVNTMLLSSFSGALTGAQLLFFTGPPRWVLNVFSQGNVIWTGQLNNANPVGTYALFNSCTGAPASVQVVAYST